MGEPTVTEATNELIPQTDLDVLMGKIVSSLQPRIEQTVEQAVHKAVETGNLRTDEKLNVLRGELRGEFQAQLKAHAEQESKRYQETLDMVNQQASETKARFSELSKQLSELFDGVKSSVGGTMQQVELLNTKIEGWGNSLSSNRHLYEDVSRKQDKLDLETDELALGLEGIKRQAETLYKTIHGKDGEDGPKSLFGEIADLRQEVAVLTKINQTGLELNRSTANRVESLERERQDEKERREKRMVAVKETINKAILENKYFWITLIAAVISAATVAAPEIASILTGWGEIVLKFFSAP